MKYSTLVHANGHMMAAMDIETTGLIVGYHEMIQIAIIPLDSDLEPDKRFEQFYHTIRPQFPERTDMRATTAHGLDIDYLSVHAPLSEYVIEWFEEWFESLHLLEEKRLIPLCHNYVFESTFLKHWLGPTHFSHFFDGAFRDTMALANSLNDMASFKGMTVPFPVTNLTSICKKLQIVNQSEHDAYHDALSCAKVYKRQITSELFEIC